MKHATTHTTSLSEEYPGLGSWLHRLADLDPAESLGDRAPGRNHSVSFVTNRRGASSLRAMVIPRPEPACIHGLGYPFLFLHAREGRYRFRIPLQYTLHRVSCKCRQALPSCGFCFPVVTESLFRGSNGRDPPPSGLFLWWCWVSQGCTSAATYDSVRAKWRWFSFLSAVNRWKEDPPSVSVCTLSSLATFVCFARL